MSMGERGIVRRCTPCVAAAVALLSASALPSQLGAQSTAVAQDSLATVTVRVRGDSAGIPRPLSGAAVGSGTVGSLTDSAGVATLRLPPRAHTIIVARVGYSRDTLRLLLRANSDTTLDIVLAFPPIMLTDGLRAAGAAPAAQPAELAGFIVSSTRGQRRVEDTPIRVETIDEEEIAEKVAMSPGDIAMMLNETSGLRVQPTNPSLGGAGVRIQGLRGRYSLILADGLPLYGGQAGGLGLLQIPPVDLARVEIIKGTASALYGSSALGGVIDLLSRRPGRSAERTVLVNGTSRGGTDAVFFGAAPLGAQNGATRNGATLLAGAHTQRRNDIDRDGWTDMPGYTRGVLRPRLYLDNGAGRTAFLTGGFTAEDREGGTADGRVTPEGIPYVESLRTRRADIGALARFVVPDSGSLLGLRALHGSILTLRGSGVEQRHAHRFGETPERDRHRTMFGEAALAVPRGNVVYVAGAAFQQESYHAENVPGFDYSFAIPSAFLQADVDARSWLALSASVRADAHSEYGTFVNPRLSLLLRTPPEGRLAGWTTRLSAGTGAFAPVPFMEETEVTGLTPLQPLENLVAERATSGSIDVGGPLDLALGRLELNGTLFASRVTSPLTVISSIRRPSVNASQIALINAPGPTRTWGGELLARVVHELGEERDGEEAPALRITGTYTYLRSTECDVLVPRFISIDDACVRREVALTPRHAAGVVATIEQEGKSRIGLELYYTGRQQLENNPYRAASRPYLIVGLMGERAFETRAGVARLFLNLENLTDVRQTRYDPLLLPSRGTGGRWTTDAWTDLSGFTVNGGVRFGW
jgi:outer membrane receptor for ferrienterochelin and colicins